MHSTELNKGRVIAIPSFRKGQFHLPYEPRNILVSRAPPSLFCRAHNTSALPPAPTSGASFPFFPAILTCEKMSKTWEIDPETRRKVSFHPSPAPQCYRKIEKKKKKALTPSLYSCWRFKNEKVTTYVATAALRAPSGRVPSLGYVFYLFIGSNFIGGFLQLTVPPPLDIHLPDMCRSPPVVFLSPSCDEKHNPDKRLRI